MLPLRDTPTLRLKFCFKQAKISYFGRYARPMPKHNLPRCFTKIVTEHQENVYGCFPLLELNLDLLDGNRCFTDKLLICIVPRATKEFTQFCIYKSIPTSLPFLSHSYSPNFYNRIVQLTRPQTTRGSTSPPLFVTLYILIQCVIVAQKRWIAKCSHRALELSRSN